MRLFGRRKIHTQTNRQRQKTDKFYSAPECVTLYYRSLSEIKTIDNKIQPVLTPVKGK